MERGRNKRHSLRIAEAILKPFMLHFLRLAFLGAFALASIVCVSVAQQTKTPVAAIESLIRSRQYDEALQATKSELRSAPSDFRLWTLQGIVLSMQGNNTDAVSAFEKALRFSPSYPPALKGEVQLLYRAKDKRAIPLLERILKTDPGDKTAHEMLGILKRAQGDCKTAAAQFQLAGDAIQSHAESLESYAYCLTQLDKYEEAIPVFEQLVALLPDRDYPRYDLAVILVRTKQNDAALKALAPVLKPDQKDPDILSLASQAYEATGDTPKAVALLRQAIVLSPTTASYYVSFATICIDHDSLQVGIDMINAGLQRIPNAPSLYLSRGLLYAQLAHYEKAEADFARVDQLDSKQALSSYAKDLTDVQRNDPDQALLKVRSHLKAHPQSPELNFLLAELLMNQSPPATSPVFKEAMRSASLALRQRPGMVAARDLVASMYIQSGQYNLAIEQCRIALKDSPNDETATYHLVVALRHTGKSGTDEMKALVKRLSAMHQESLKHETDRKRFRLVEESAPPAN